MNPDKNLRSTQKRALALVIGGAAIWVFSFWPGFGKQVLPVDRGLFTDVDTTPYRPPLPLEINTADTTEWASLWGIGPVLSRRIVKFRESKGGFASVEEVKSVYGLKEETFEAILPYLKVDTLGAAFLALKEKKDQRNQRLKSPKYVKVPNVIIEINTADSADLRKIRGIGPVLAGRIVKYRSRRGGFDQPEDLLEVYGIKEGENYEQIATQVRVDTSLKPASHSFGKTDTYSNWKKDSSYTWKATKYDAEPIDLNRSDTTALKGLPGIGSKTAIRLVRFRSKLGFFHSVDQLHEVWGLSETNYLRMEPYLFVEELEALPHVRVNDYSVKELAGHPYIEYKLAKQIVAYRGAHGPYQNIESLDNLYGVPEGTWEKLRPYLRFK